MHYLRAIALAASLLGASFAGLATARSDAQLTGHLTRSAETKTTCDATNTRTIVPDAIRACETSTVTLQVYPRCDPVPLDVALMFGSGWCFETETLYRNWQATAVQSLGMGDNPHVRAAVVWYDKNGARLRAPLTASYARVRGALGNPLECYDFAERREDCYSCAARMAVDALQAGEAQQSRTTVGLMVGVHPWFPAAQADFVRAAQIVKAYNNSLFVWGCPWPELGDCNFRPFWTAVSPGYFFQGPSSGQFGGAIRTLVRRSTTSNLDAVSIVERVPAEVAVVPGSISPTLAVLSPSGRSIRWDFTAPVTPSLTLTYRVAPLDGLPLPRTVSFTGATAHLTDTRRLSRLVPIPDGALTVTGPCAIPTPPPSPTASPTPTETPAPTVPSATATPPATLTATPTDTATAVPTRAPQPLFLPLALRERCVPGQKHMDVALVIDASTSMLEQTAAGRTKLAAAQEAAGAFVGALHLDAGDQAAIVAFNATAEVLRGLTADRPALDAALAAIDVAPTTRLDLAIAAAADELAGAGHRPENTPVMIVLTDGKANPVGPEVAVAKARAAKDAGVVIFTIGVGTELDDWALLAIASKPAYFYRAPDAEALKAIYAAIAVEIPCPAEDYWGAR